MNWSRNKRLLLALLLFVAVLATFLPALSNDFVGYDDPVYVTANSHVQQGVNWSSIRWAFTTFYAGNWHPLTWLSHTLDCQLFGLQAAWHHLVSVVIHSLSVVLWFFVLHRMTGALWPSFAAAFLFGIHPLRVESVAWVAERKDVLSAFFWMLTIWAYVCYAERRGCKLQHPTSNIQTLDCNAAAPSASRITRYYYLLALFCFALGLMSKAMVVTLPFVLLLLDYWPLRRVPVCNLQLTSAGVSRLKPATFSRLLLEKVPFFVLAAFACVLTFVAQKNAGALMTNLPLDARAANALVSYSRYLGKFFWPIDLAVFYPPVSHWPGLTVLASALLLSAISILVAFARRSQPWLIVGWLWFLGTLMPVIGLVQAGEQAMADRYTYLPSIGLLLMLVWFGRSMVLRFGGNVQRTGVEQGSQIHKTAQTPRLAHRIVYGSILVLVALAWALLSQKQIRYWKDTETLFWHAMAITKNNYLAHGNLGAALEKQGRLAEAADQLQQALKVKPNYVEAHNNLGVVLDKQGRLDEAIRHYLEAVKLNPKYAIAYINLGNVLAKQGRLDDAIEQYHRAINLQRDLPDAYYDLGVALGRKGFANDAIAVFERALELQPNSADIHNNLGVALDRIGKTDDAIRHYVAALKLNPDSASAHFNLGVALVRKNLYEDAIRQFQEALRLRPDYPEAAKNLAALVSARTK